MIKVERNENLYESMQKKKKKKKKKNKKNKKNYFTLKKKKKKKKKNLYQHNFFLSTWPSNMGCWVLGIRVFEGSCAPQILWS
jgi:hypothetical protein